MFSLRVDQNIKIFVIILTICLYFVCLGARCITKALEPVPHPVWQHICEQWGPAFCILHGLLHDRGPSMLQHRQPHGDSKRKEFSQSGDHHSPIRQPVHVRDSNSLTFRRTASWRGPLTEMCVRRGLLDIHLVTLDYRHPEAFPGINLMFMDGNWRKYCILYGILKSHEPFPWWSSGTLWRTSHIVSLSDMNILYWNGGVQWVKLWT